MFIFFLLIFCGLLKAETYLGDFKNNSFLFAIEYCINFCGGGDNNDFQAQFLLFNP